MLATKVESRTTHDNVFNALPEGVVNFTAEAIKATSPLLWELTWQDFGTWRSFYWNDSKWKPRGKYADAERAALSKDFYGGWGFSPSAKGSHVSASWVWVWVSSAFICGGKGALCVQLWTSLDPRWLTQDTPQVSSLLNRESLYPGKEEQPEHMAAACEQTAVFPETSAYCQILISFQILLDFHR